MLAPQEHFDVFYPESDGKPMAETDVHRILLLKMVDLLQNAFPQAYVSGNICLYYERGNPRKMISPDSLLCRSQPPQQKRVYLAWEPNAQLDLVVELSSFSTRREDHGKKKRIYEEILHVPYYVIFDPHGIYLTAFELREGLYQTMEPDIRGRYHLAGLGIQIAIAGENDLRLFDKEGRPILTTDQAAIAQKDAAMAEKDAAVAEKDAAVAEKDVAVAEKDAAIAQKDAAVAEKERFRQLLLAAGIDPDR